MRISELLGLQVETESGEELGHVHDVRVERDPRSASEHAGQRWHVKALVVGRRGLFERIGLAGARRVEPVLQKDAVPWGAIVRIREGRVVVVPDGRKLR
jgi:sporulation protein YlmC with PRC-barrel domain